MDEASAQKEAQAPKRPVPITPSSEQQPKGSNDSDSLIIRILDWEMENRTTFFNVKKDTERDRVFSLYGQRKGVDWLYLRF